MVSEFCRADGATETVTVNLSPDVLQQMILSGNKDIYTQLLSLEDARDKLQGARSALLPSINVSVSSVPNFIVSGLSALLPFLLPSNYFQLDEAHDTFLAHMDAFKIYELNTVATGLSLYFTVMADLKTVQVYKAEAQDLRAIANYQAALQGVNYSYEQVLNAQSLAATAEGNAKDLQAKVAGEIENLKNSVGLTDAHQQITILDVDMPASVDESLDPQWVTQLALRQSPELDQAKHLVSAAQSGVDAAEFGILSSVSLVAEQAGQTANSSVSFSKYKATGTASFSFGTLDTVSISERSVTEAQAQVGLLQDSEATLINSTLQAINLQAQAMNDFQKAMSAAQQSYALTLANYQVGTVNYVDLMTAHNTMVQAQIKLINEELGLNLNRVTLHRALMTANFANIKGCLAQPVKPGGFWSLFGDFSPQYTLIELCKENGTNQSD